MYGNWKQTIELLNDVWCVLLLYCLQLLKQYFQIALANQCCFAYLYNYAWTGERIWAQWSKTISEQKKRNGEIEISYRWIKPKVSPKSEWFHQIPTFKWGWASWNALWVPKGKLESKLESTVPSKGAISNP